MRGLPRAREEPKRPSLLLQAVLYAANRTREEFLPEAVWRVCSLIFAHPPDNELDTELCCCSFQMITFPS